jgi:hypothetical protein
MPFLVPFSPNPRFIGRESQLAELEKKLFIGASTTKVAVTGPGGIGKTQLALELAYRIRQELKNCSVFWISARAESLHQAYEHIAQRLSIPDWDNKKADVKKLVQIHLSKESAGQWLLIFDNVDEATLESAGSSNLIEYLPSSKQGAIVFTTTNRTTAAKLASQNIVELPEMEQDMAQKMLEMCLVYPANEQEKADLLPQELVDLLLKELAYLPLAIVQAAAYININKITLQEYLLLLAEQKGEVVKPNSKECDVIATTWLISFEQIRRHNTLAANYLLFMACVDQNDVPLDLLPATSPREKGVSAVEILNAYSFITKRTAESALDLHQLVHVSTRNWLKGKGLLSQQTQIAITRLLEVFPNHYHGSRSKWRRLLPHAKFALSSGLPGQDNKARKNLVWKYAMALHSDGRFNEAELYFQETVQSRSRVLGDKHPATLNSMASLALTYGNQGRWKEAEELEMQVMETSKRVLGEEHLDTLNSIANLASTYSNQGRWKEAEELEVQVIETRKRVLGEEHPDTLTSMANLASTFWNQGRWKEAEELEVEAMETSKRVLGEEHPDTLNIIANLASTFWNQGRWKEAEELEVQVMETSNRVLGEEHLDTLISIANLASTYRNQGRWKEAEELEVQVVETSKRVLGEEHPDTLNSIANLASTYRNQGRWKEAEELGVQVMEMRKRVLGEEHPDTLTSMAGLASTYSNQGRWKEAEELGVQVMETRKRVLGEEHPDTLTSMNNFAFTLKRQGRNDDAVLVLKLYLQLGRHVFGSQHPNILSSLNALDEWQKEGLATSV